MIREVASLPPIARDAFVGQHFEGLQLSVAGVVGSCNSVGKQATVYLKNKSDGTRIAALFSHPFAAELLTLREGDDVAVVGDVYMVANSGVVLKNCVLRLRERKADILASAKQEWHQRWWGNLAIQIVAALVAGLFVAYFAWRHFH